MLNCTYTKDKVKKSKIWKDGYIALKDKRLVLYDEDKKQIYSFIYKNLSEETITPVYLIYCEELTIPSEESVNEEKIEKQNEIKHEKQKSYTKNEYNTKSVYNRQTSVVQKPVKNTSKIEITKRSKYEILNLLNNIK
ncbi:hypothetical protein BDAP_000990 [Binucleata daphniae]